PYFEGHQLVQAEGVAQGNVGRIPAPRHQDPPDAPGVIPRVEDDPFPADVSFKPRREIHRPGGRHADVAEVAGAIARREVHAAAERNRQMREIAADAGSLVERFPGSFRRTSMPVAERDVMVNVVADRLYPLET